MKKLNLMQKASYCSYILLVAVLFSSCNNVEHEPNKVTPDFEVKNIDVKGGWQYQIIVYKGHEYLCYSSNGGIIHTESCGCKNGN